MPGKEQAMATDANADLDARLDSVAALGEPVRRALYLFVTAQADPVTREQAAAGVGVAVHVAKFHLDKLEAEGLLEVDFARPEGRSGPGAGRPAKTYRRAGHDIDVSLPPRRYELAGQVMAAAIDRTRRTGGSLERALRDAAAAAGREIGAQTAENGSPDESVLAALAASGFEPRVECGQIVLLNCPFQRLARQHTELVCGMNLNLLRALLDELSADALSAELNPQAGRCCVTLRQADRG
jgi:predicted ArsR family transcriptional regulator